MADLPLYIYILFGSTLLTTIIWFHYAVRSKPFLFVMIGWTIIQALIALSGIYQDTESMPPNMALYGVFPTLLAMIFVFLTKKGRAFMDRINLKTLTYFHSIRLPVEIVLALLFYYGSVSVYMTFEGTNFDIFSGATAALMAYFAYRKTGSRKTLLLMWNILCLLLLLNVVTTSVLTLPSPFQKIFLEQEAFAVLHFPFSLLPTVIVPLVLFAHLVAIRRLTLKSKK